MISSLTRRLQERNQRICAHLALVEPYSSRYAACSAESREDLRQVALLGLIRAAERYCSSQAVPFAAFARPHIRGAILHYLRDLAPLVRAPRRLQERQWQLQRSRVLLRQRLGRDASDAELQQLLGLNQRQWQHLHQHGARCRRQPWDPELFAEEAEAAAAAETVETWPAAAPAALQALTALAPREQQLVRAVVLEGLSLRRAARQQELSVATAHRLLRRGLEELRLRLSPASGVPGC